MTIWDELKRCWCRWFKHKWADGGSSMLAFPVCLRCGKIGRYEGQGKRW